MRYATLAHARARASGVSPRARDRMRAASLCLGALRRQAVPCCAVLCCAVQARETGSSTTSKAQAGFPHAVPAAHRFGWLDERGGSVLQLCYMALLQLARSATIARAGLAWLPHGPQVPAGACVCRWLEVVQPHRRSAADGRVAGRARRAAEPRGGLVQPRAHIPQDFGRAGLVRGPHRLGRVRPRLHRLFVCVFACFCAPGRALRHAAARASQR